MTAKEILFAKIMLQDIYRGSFGEGSNASKIISEAEINTAER